MKRPIIQLAILASFTFLSSCDKEFHIEEKKIDNMSKQANSQPFSTINS